jgi:hypothetical protein
MSEWERRLEAWRQAARQSGLDADALDELESHLRDEMQQQVRAGHPELRAFELAVERLGAPQALAAEFARAGAAPALWLPLALTAGVLAVLSVLVAGVMLDRLLMGTMTALLAAHVYAAIVGYTLTFGGGFLAFVYVLRRTRSDLDPGRTRSLSHGLALLNGAAAVMTALAFLLGGVWARQNLGQFWEGDPREVGAVCALAWNVLLCAVLVRRLLPQGVAVLLGLVGNVIGYCAWFVANSPAGSMRATHAVVILAHLAVLGVGLAQARWLTRRASAGGA